ncbi:MAG: porin, partial [Burkholderiales bacterium]
MNKKLMAVAVAGALAVPGVALAQSSVTISGIFKISVDNQRYGGSARTPNSQWRTADDSSRIIFNVTEDLGGGLQAIGQVDWRPQLDAGGDAASGNNWVGLRSKSWGTLTVGRHDLHYGKQPDEIAAKAGSLKLTAISLMDFTANGTAIAGATRTTNVVRYDSPRWGGFAFTAAYSFNATAPEADIAAGAGVRKGNAWNLNPSYTGKNFQLGWSHWRSKVDGAAAAAAAPAALGGAVVGQDQRSDSLYGYYTWGGFKIGMGWNKSRTSRNGVVGNDQNRTAWTIPVRYNWGKHNIYAHYTRA